jgi:ubiquinone/menaquinone biosynthesis C-methylase UbiE
MTDWPRRGGEDGGPDRPYVLPRHPAEVDRLDLQHYAFRHLLRGNYLAPIRGPCDILDVGSGTGQWAYEMCEEFPEALVVGCDLEPSKGEVSGQRPRALIAVRQAAIDYNIDRTTLHRHLRTGQLRSHHRPRDRRTYVDVDELEALFTVGRAPRPEAAEADKPGVAERRGLPPTRSPHNYRFVRCNVLQGLPFPDGTFEYVHQRLMVAGIPVQRWPAVVQDLVRVTRPGGLVELLEVTTEVEPIGPAMRRMWEVFARMGRTRGLDTLGHVYRSMERYLAQAGAVAVEVHTLQMPIGEWAGQPGVLMATDFRSLMTRLAPAFEAFGLPEAECHDLTATMMLEFEELHPSLETKVVVGRRPERTY